MLGIPGFHSGGIVGLEGTRRFVSLLPRYHSGGLAGDEQLAVLRDGEAVFTPKQLQALGSVGGTTIFNVNIKAVDAKSVQELFMGQSGTIESIMVNKLSRNGAFRAALQRG